jgi:predicted nucleic acid-binding protein
MLAGVKLVAVDVASLVRASKIEPFEVRTLDAIHLYAALELRARGGIAAVMIYDRQLQAGCAHHGLTVEAPTAT